MILSKKKANAKKILLVDDDLPILTAMLIRLTKSGFDVITASDGLEGITRAENELPDLILLDNVMPKMDGLTALTKLRASEKTKHIPVIMVTSLADEDKITSAQEGGANDYVVKPFSYSVMSEKIDKVLGANKHSS
jgi:DNA-binding response OmpR family regulator